MLRFFFLSILFSCQSLCQFIEITEADYFGPDDISLFPGTSIRGGVTPSTDTDIYRFEFPSVQPNLFDEVESITFRLDYTHSSNFLSPRAHLSAEVYSTVTIGGQPAPDVLRGSLSTRILFGDSPNTLTLKIPRDDLLKDESIPGSVATEHYVVISSRSGVNPDYTLTINADAAIDRFDLIASNETQATATVLSAKDPSQIIFREGKLTFHKITDTDWYQFTPGVSGNYHARISQSIIQGPSTPCELEVRNNLGQILATPTTATDPPISFSVFTATAGETYFIKTSPGDFGTSFYELHLSLITLEEPTPPTIGRRGSRQFFDISAVTSGPLTLGPFSMDSSFGGGFSPGEFDFLRFENTTINRYLVTMSSENERPPVFLPSDDTRIRKTVRNQTFIYTAAGRSFDIDLYAGNEDQLGFYTVKIRPVEAFDIWWLGVGGPVEKETEVNGLAAGLIYALNLDPLADHGSLFQIASSESEISLVLSLPAEGTNAAVTLQESPDLVSWSEISVENLNQASSTIPAGTFGTISISYPLDESRRFVRAVFTE